MKIQQINNINYYNKKRQNLNNTTPNFTGLNLSAARDLFISPTEKMARDNFAKQVSLFFNNYNSKPIIKLIRGNNGKRNSFLYQLAERYNTESFNHSELFDNTNKLEETINTYKSIKNPHRWYFSIIHNNNYSFDNVLKLLNTIKKDSQGQLYLKLQSLQDSGVNINPNDIASILHINNSKKLLKNFDKFKSYIILNHQNKDFIEGLNKELSRKKPTFSPAEINKQLKYKSLKENPHIMRVLPQDSDTKNITLEGIKLLSEPYTTITKLFKPNETITEQDKSFFKYLLETTNKDNYDNRKYFLVSNTKPENNSYSDIKAFFEEIDKNKASKELYKDLRQNNSALLAQPINEFMYYINSFGSDTLLKKSKNFINIINSNNHLLDEPEKIRDILVNNLNNKYYITPYQIMNAKSRESYVRISNIFFGELKAKMMKYNRIIKYQIMPSMFGTGKPTPLKQDITYTKRRPIIVKQNPIEQTAPKAIESKEVIPRQQEEKIPAPIISPAITKPKKVRSRDTKEQIKEAAINIIRSKMRRTKIDYTLTIKRFTKMRNKNLEEMFASVKETRAAQRAKGMKPTVSNKDVITLYSKIKGSNRRACEYLLKARKANGEREFNIKQIINALDDIERNRPPKRPKISLYIKDNSRKTKTTNKHNKK